jgi:hypothetical protein
METPNTIHILPLAAQNHSAEGGFRESVVLWSTYTARVAGLVIVGEEAIFCRRVKETANHLPTPLAN